MLRKLLGLCLIFSLWVTGLACAEGTDAVQLAIYSPVQLFSADDSIKGLRLDLLYTNNKDVSGITLGTGWARTRGDLKGVSIGAVNWTNALSYGLKVGLLNYAGNQSVGLDIGVVNISRRNTKGIQFGVVNWNEGFFNGWQFGVVNDVNGPFVGFQCGLFNYTAEMNGLQLGFFNTSHSGTMAGFQLGLINYAAKMNGLQLGVFNATPSLNGLQIGLANYNGNKDPMVFMFLANWSF